jgi:CheY-like chemotaxis protein
MDAHASTKRSNGSLRLRSFDIGMPDMTGYAVAKAMRAEDLGRKVLIIAVTGYGSPQDIQLAMDAGFDLHLVKPADPARILEGCVQPQKRAPVTCTRSRIDARRRE